MYAHRLFLCFLVPITLAHSVEPDLESRLKGMLWGALLADAAALGAHWYYDQEDLKARFPEGIQGFEQPALDHYHKSKQSGEFTMYGDAMMLLLEVAATDSGYSPAAFGKRFMFTMTPGHYSGYIDHATQDSFEIYQTHLKSQPEVVFDFQQGSDDNQMAAATSLTPIVALYHDDPQYYERIAEFVRIRQNNAEAIAYCQLQAGILRALLQGLDPESATADALATAPIDSMMREVITARLRDVHAELLKDDVTASTYTLGYSCPLRGSFAASLYSFIELKELSYTEAIISIIEAGGESAGRGMVAGAFLGAYWGEAHIPESWRTKLLERKKAEKWISKIVE